MTAVVLAPEDEQARLLLPPGPCRTDGPPSSGMASAWKERSSAAVNRSMSGSNIRDEEGTPWSSRIAGASFGPASRQKIESPSIEPDREA